MKTNRNKKGFTLVEMLIAIAVFAILSMLGAAVFTNVSRMQKRISLENAMLEDARYMMERMVKLARLSTVDYEEYYNQKVLTPLLESPTNYVTYGDNYGYYATMFYNPNLNANEGTDGNSIDTSTVDGSSRFYGAFYNNKKPATELCRIDRQKRILDDSGNYNGQNYVCPPNTQKTYPPDPGSELLYDRSIDSNDGANPFPRNSGDPSGNYSSYTASAFCDNHKKGGVPECTNADPLNYNKFFTQDELYLIDQFGQRKYIFAREQVASNPDQYVLSMLEMEGVDTNLNGIVDKWKCAEGYNCTKTRNSERVPNKDDKTRIDAGQNLYNDFIPISPLRANIVDLKFYVSPLEDPRKGFSEGEKFVGVTLPEFMLQPHVTIVMTVEPAESQLSGLQGMEPPRVTLQTTVSSRVMHDVKSYGG